MNPCRCWAAVLTAVLLLPHGAARADTATEAYELGRLYLDSQEYDAAIEAYTEAIRLDAKFTTAYNDRGLAYFKKADFDKAIEDYSEAIRLDPKLASAYMGRADAYDRKSKFDKAFADYSETIRLDPKFMMAYIGRCHIYVIKGDCDKAMEDAVESLRLDPKSAMAYNHVGIAYDGYAKAMLATDAESAASLFDRASRISTGRPARSTRCNSSCPSTARWSISGRQPGNSTASASGSCCSTTRPRPSRRPLTFRRATISATTTWASTMPGGTHRKTWNWR